MISAAFILGLLGSWHCVAMCGPIALIIPTAHGKNRIYSILLYHSGKIFAYMVIGSLVGMFAIFLESLKIQAIITIAIGIFIAILALVPFILKKVEQKGYVLFSSYFKLKAKIASSLKKDRLDYSFYIGFMNGFIPCGLVYVAALGALAQSNHLEAITFMLFFGLGTAPFMSLLIFFSDHLKKRFQKHGGLLRTMAIALVGVFMIWKGISNYNTQFEEEKVGDHFQICNTY
jgi:sulfite exporter TauE/SafE